MSYHSLVIFLSQTAQDISEVNVLALFECLSTRGSSLLNKDEPNQSSSWCQPTDSIITEEKIQNDPPASQTHPAEQQTQAHGNIILCQNIVNVLLLTVKCCKPIKPKQSVSYTFALCPCVFLQICWTWVEWKCHFCLQTRSANFLSKTNTVTCSTPSSVQPGEAHS